MNKFLIVLTIAMLVIGNAEARNHKHKHKHHKAKSVKVVMFSAKSYLVADANGVILKEQAGDVVRPIASISKLMVAVLASEQDLDEKLAIPTKRQVQSKIPKNVRFLTRKQLLTLALVKSDNFAAQILCTNLPNCVGKMNERAQELGMKNTYFVEPTGLDKGNVSTAHDLLKLVMVASTVPIITELSGMAKAEIQTSNKRPIKIHNTNPLTSTFSILLSKTGYTVPAGGCLVMILKTEVGTKIFVLLGSRNVRTRIPDMKQLIKES